MLKFCNILNTKMFSVIFDDFLVFGILLSQLIRFCVSRWPYSGSGKPPMFGDYEAQRHWMEITINLPADEWYKNSTLNDLQYWGLDYPPLTAYQSKIFGYIAQLYNPDWVALNASRGYEGYEHKVFMRSTVMLMDVLVFYVAAISYWYSVPAPSKQRDKAIAASLTLLYPGLILIDHGHFQYNCVSLGLTLLAVALLLRQYDLLSAMCFCLSLHYKQMSLYHALPFFSYFLGRCIKAELKPGLTKFFQLAFVVIMTSVICWAPFLQSLDTFYSVVNRLFPVDRGLFEDKVANVWCALSIIIKFKNLFSAPTLVQVSAVATLLASLPSSYYLLRVPSFRMFRLSLVNVSFAFFLFSYQVHEKSILLVALPVLLLIEDYPFACSWFLLISTYSLVPLLAKDGLIIPYFSLMAMFFICLLRAYDGLLSWKDKQTSAKAAAFLTSVLGSAGLVISMYSAQQPKQYPHLHVLINCLYSCAHFVGFAVYFNKLQYQLATQELSKKEKEL